MYFNPRVENKEDNVPVSYWCYKTSEQDMWISMIGCIGDWYWPDFADEFKKKYPDLVPESVKDAETALFETELGKLITILGFSLKGTTKDAMKCAKIWTRIKTPYEVLNQETPAGKYLYKIYEQVNHEYANLLKKALEKEKEGKLILFEYQAGKISLTKDIANELLHRHPDNIIIIAREKGDEMKMSIRSKTIVLTKILEKALEGIEGYGGGHEYACGANIKTKDFAQFIENFKKQL
jgi:hypothetical protein